MHKLTCEVKTTKMKKKPASKFPCEPSSFFPLSVLFIQTPTFNTVFNTVNQLTPIVG